MHKKKSKVMSKQRNQILKTGQVLLFLAPFLVSFVVFFVFPFGLGIVMSLSKFSGRSFLPSGYVGLDNFIRVFTHRTLSRDFWSAVLVTFKFALIIVPLSIIIPFLLAFLVNKKPFGYKFFRAAIYVPGIFPIMATGVILLRMFSFHNGFVNHFFNISLNWFGEKRLTWIMIGAFCIWGGIGTNFLIFNAGLENVDTALYEASEVDGATNIQKFFKITIPSLRYQLLLALFTTFIGYMNLYGQVFILANRNPDLNEMKSAVFRIQEMLTGSSQFFGYAAAMGIMLGLIIGVISLIQLIVTRERKRGNKHATAFMDWQESR